MLYALGQKQVLINESCYIAPGAVVIGDVRFGDRCSVWFNAVIRGDNDSIVIGDGSNVQDGSVLHVDEGFPLSIGRNVTIGHKAMLHGCTIGEGSLIGMGATILNGAVIGKGCLIGAGALITEGKVIPDASLVMGAPGKVVRMLDVETQSGLINTALGYQANMRRFRSGLSAI